MCSYTDDNQPNGSIGSISREILERYPEVCQKEIQLKSFVKLPINLVGFSGVECFDDFFKKDFLEFQLEYLLKFLEKL